MDDQPKHTRRIRYSGTHPKTFKENYKDLNPDQYADEVDNILQQGKTPAGMHRSICVQEILDFLQLFDPAMKFRQAEHFCSPFGCT